MEKIVFYALISTHMTWIFASTHIDSSPCKDRISIKKCRYYRTHFACRTHKKKMERLCTDTCGFCNRIRKRSGQLHDLGNCKNSIYGCCRDDTTPAKGPNFFGCNDHCSDSKGKRYCVLIKKAGFCASKNSHYYKDCLKTCGVCRECEDDPAVDCEHLLQYSFCDKQKVKAMNHCRKSCHRCGKTDPCFGHRCHDDEKCRVDNHGSPFCACKVKCDHDDHETGPLCGRDGIQYKDLCHFKHKRCKSKSKLKVRNYGSCNGVYKKAIYPTGLIMKRNQKQDGIGDNNSNALLVPLPAHRGASSYRFFGDCKDFSDIFCKRFIPACGYESNRDLMQQFCPQTCGYCD